VRQTAGKALRALDPELAIQKVGTLEERLGRIDAPTRFQSLLMSLFAVVALVLAAVGLYGVLAQTVALRTREIGIRMALGARPAQVRRMVGGHALVLTGAGTLIGLAGALAGGRIIRGLLFEVSPTDPTTLVAAVALLMLVAACATWLPARRATQVDPATTLRSE
jgi:putative ABC transport system permease protein